MGTEADACRKYILPKLYTAGWTDEFIKEQRTFTDGRIQVVGRTGKRRDGKRADYLLYGKRDYPLAVVEAKDEYHLPADGLQQAKEYAEILDLKFAYSSNGQGIVEFDFLSGEEKVLEDFPSPQELWNRLRAHRGLPQQLEDKLLTPFNLSDRVPRYYQTNAIQRASEAILRNQKRILLTLATGTGKTEIAFQIAWKLHSTRWNRRGVHARPKILFLADRDILISDPKDKTFAPFGEARHRLEGGKINTSRDIYFATYQALAGDGFSPGLYTRIKADFFDLILIDEAHRGSADENSSWRGVLEHFSDAIQLGLTATPLREDSRDTYAYFGNPIYTYSLKQGIEDGFLAPYQVRRIVSDVDAAGWRPTPELRDAYGREVPDRLYETRDFERLLSLLPRTRAVARHLVDYLRTTDLMAKTLVFCEDQMHAEQMRHEIAKLVPELLKVYPDYVCRVVSDEGDVGKGHLSTFQDVENPSPVVLTTSRMLSTGVDAPTVRNVVLFRGVGTMTEFKQIIGRGTRVREDYGKLWFTILDYTGSATQKFADPDFDGVPSSVMESEMTVEGNEVAGDVGAPEWVDPPSGQGSLKADLDEPPRKLLVLEGVRVSIAHEVVYELGVDGKPLRVTQYTAYTGEQVRTMFADPEALKVGWLDPRERKLIVQKLEERGVSLEQLENVMSGEDHDPLDLLCHLAYGAALLTRKERASAAREKSAAFLAQYSSAARAILEDLLEHYTHTGVESLESMTVFKVLPSSRHLKLGEVVRYFGGEAKLGEAMKVLEAAIYA